MIKVTYNGIEMTVKQAAIESKISMKILYERIQIGFTEEIGLFNPVRLYRRPEVCILDGKEITVIEASKTVGVSPSTIRRRYKEGLTQETGLFTKR